MFNEALAREAGLSSSDIAQLVRLIYEHRQRLNEEIAKRAVVERLSEREKLVSFLIGETKGNEMRQQFWQDASNLIDADKVRALGQSEIPDRIDASLEQWGRYATGYRIEYTDEKLGQEQLVKVYVISDKHLPTTLMRSYPRSMFEAIYGPIAELVPPTR